MTLRPYAVICEQIDGSLVEFTQFAPSPKQALIRARKAPQMADIECPSRFGISERLGGSGTSLDPWRSRIHWER